MGGSIMASTINSDTSNGLILTPDTTGEIELQSAGVTKAKITSSGLQNASGSAITSQAGKNLIINGDMAIDQRNAGASATSNGSVYTVDRYEFQMSSVTNVQTYQQVTDAPAGFNKSLKITNNSTTQATAAGVLCTPRQKIEGLNTAYLNWGTSDAQTVTVSFWVKASVTGTYPVALTNNDFSRSFVTNYTVSVANTWEYKTVTIAGDTSGTWTVNTTTGINVLFSLDTGSTYQTTAGSWQAGNYRGTSSDVHFLANASATWQITGVQLEANTTATPFEYLQYGQQLALCERYFSTSYGNNPVGTNTWDGTYAGRNYNTSSRGENVVNIHLPVQMRASPTLTAYSKAGTSGKLVAGSTSVDSSATELTCSLLGSSTILRAVTGATIGAALWYQFHYTAEAEL